MKVVKMLFVAAGLLLSSLVFGQAQGERVPDAAVPTAEQLPLKNIDPMALATLPSKLSGRWNTPDNRATQTWGVEDIDMKKGVGKLTYYSTRAGCTVRGLEVPVGFDGKTFTLSASGKMPCGTTFEAVLEKTPDGYVGVINVTATNPDPVLKAVLR